MQAHMCQSWSIHNWANLPCIILITAKWTTHIYYNSLNLINQIDYNLYQKDEIYILQVKEKDEDWGWGRGGDWSVPIKNGSERKMTRWLSLLWIAILPFQMSWGVDGNCFSYKICVQLYVTFISSVFPSYRNYTSLETYSFLIMLFHLHLTIKNARKRE